MVSSRGNWSNLCDRAEGSYDFFHVCEARPVQLGPICKARRLTKAGAVSGVATGRKGRTTFPCLRSATSSSGQLRSDDTCVRLRYIFRLFRSARLIWRCRTSSHFVTYCRCLILDLRLFKRSWSTLLGIGFLSISSKFHSDIFLIYIHGFHEQGKLCGGSRSADNGASSPSTTAVELYILQKR